VTTIIDKTYKQNTEQCSTCMKSAKSVKKTDWCNRGNSINTSKKY